MDNRPIGVFDSGVGGLTALKAICNIMPQENVIYFGDTKNMPYGDKGKDVVIGYAEKIVGFLKKRNVKAILAACGTVSSHINLLKEKIFGVINPACDEALKLTKNKKIGILGTRTTVKSGSYPSRIALLDPEITCFQVPCPLLAPMIENGIISAEEKQLKKVLWDYISPLAEKGVDTIILGCTHYPIVLPVIQSMFGGINLVDPGQQAGYALSKFLEENDMNCSAENEGYKSFYVSGSKIEFEKTAKIFLGKSAEIKIQEGGDLN